MKCWKCGNENNGCSVCRQCGVNQIRSNTVTPEGKALRDIYDHFGCKEVFENSDYITHSLKDLIDDPELLCLHIQLAYKAGIGKEYYSRVQIVGESDSHFEDTIRSRLTKQAGISDEYADNLIGFFNEMIGWKVDSDNKEQVGAVEPDIDIVNEDKTIRDSEQSVDHPDNSTHPKHMTGISVIQIVSFIIVALLSLWLVLGPCKSNDFINASKMYYIEKSAINIESIIGIVTASAIVGVVLSIIKLLNIKKGNYNFVLPMAIIGIWIVIAVVADVCFYSNYVTYSILYFNVFSEFFPYTDIQIIQSMWYILFSLSFWELTNRGYRRAYKSHKQDYSLYLSTRYLLINLVVIAFLNRNIYKVFL